MVKILYNGVQETISLHIGYNILTIFQDFTSYLCYVDSVGTFPHLY